MKLKTLVSTVLFVSMWLVSLTLSQPPTFNLEKERGSWCDEMLFKIFINDEERMVRMMYHEVDACGEPSPVGFPTLKIVGDGIPTPDDIPLLEASDYSLASTSGFDMSFYAINCRTAMAPLDDPVFRTALAYAIDKGTIIPTLYGPMAMPLYNFVPPAQEFWYDSTVEGTFPKFNLQTAIATLIGGGYTPVLINPGGIAEPGNIDHWNMPAPANPPNTPIRPLTQTVPVESDLAQVMSMWIESDMQSIGLPVIHQPMPFNFIVYGDWLAAPYLNWDLTVGIGFSLGQNPFLYEMFDGASIPLWNIWGIADPAVNMWTTALRGSLNPVTAQGNAYAAEAALVTAMPIIPMMASMKWSAIANTYDGEPGGLGWVNMKGHGGYNIWSALYSRREYPNGDSYQQNTWLMAEDADKLNPLTSGTAYEWQLLSLIYSTLLQKNPYTLEDIPWCVTGMPTVQPWNGTRREVSPGVWVYDPSPIGAPPGVPITGEYMRWTLRDDMTWHDGTPVTSADVEFCLDLLVNQINAKYSAIQTLIHDVNVVDTYTFDVYYKGRYPWAILDISEVALLAPKHIWAPYIAGEDLTLWTVDDNDHRFWDGSDWISMDWSTQAGGDYTAPSVNTPSGSVQLTHLQGNGPFVYPYGGWVPGQSIRLIRWYDPSTGTGWHFTRILRGDNNFDGFVDTRDMNPVTSASGTQSGMPKWVENNAGPRADMANPSGLIDGRDRAALLETWGFYWYPKSTLPPP